MVTGQSRIRRGPARREPDLRPSRWSVRPRRGTALRAVLVAALLALASGVLYTLPAEPSAGGACPTGNGPARPTGPSTGPAPDGPPPAAAGDLASPPTERADVGSGRLPLPAGTVGVPVRLAEPAALAVISPGARVDLLAVPAARASTRSAEPALLATRVLVLDVVRPDTGDGSAALYLALRPDEAHRTVRMPADARFAILVRS